MSEIIELTNAGSTVKVDKYALSVDSIKAIAKPSNGDGCIVYLVGDKFLVKESYDEVKKMMERYAITVGTVVEDNSIGKWSIALEDSNGGEKSLTDEVLDS